MGADHVDWGPAMGASVLALRRRAKFDGSFWLAQ